MVVTLVSRFVRTSNFTIKVKNANQNVTNLTLSGNKVNIALQKSSL